jgi:arginine decarboxylase
VLATTLEVDFDPESDWNDREQVFKMSGKIVKIFNIPQSAEGDKTGLWTTVIAAATLLP